MFSKVVCALALATVALPTGASECEAKSRRAAPEALVITEWNAIAQRIIFAEAGTPVPASGLYFSDVSLAVYDAVVSVEGRYERYVKRDRSFEIASAPVAAATAASVILRNYFPDSAGVLRTEYRRTLADVPRDQAFANGARAGIAAAASVIVRRLGDGRNDPEVALDVAREPGVWRPTPPDGAPMAVPWLGFVEPYVLDSPDQFDLPAPHPLLSHAYAEDFNEVKRDGVLTGSNRTGAQTETALFFSVNAMAQYQEGMRDLVARHGLGIVESARAFALLSTATADALISCWRATFDHPTWRPISAIRLAGTDGNAATTPDPHWTPLFATPPYPDFASGHACITGAASGTFSHLFGSETIDLDLISAPLASLGILQRHYDGAAALDQDAMDAEVWLGITFRSSVRVANGLGHEVADWAAANFFQPTSERRSPATPSPGDGIPTRQPATDVQEAFRPGEGAALSCGGTVAST